MPKIYEITPSDGVAARLFMKKIKSSTVYRRLEVIALRGEGYSPTEIALQTHFNLTYVSELIGKYVREGFDGLSQEGRKGGNSRKVSFEQEEQFLAAFHEKALTGELVTSTEMWHAFEEKFQVTTTRNNFYKLLNRHGWRKVKPRPQHPKAADASTQEASKKLSPFTERQENAYMSWHFQGVSD